MPLDLRKQVWERKLYVEVTLIRTSPRALDDDNYVAACKHLRDGVALGLEIDDNDPRITFLYWQRKGAPRQQDIHIEIRFRS